MRYLGISAPKIVRYWLRVKLEVAYYYLKYCIINFESLLKTYKLKNTKKNNKVFVFGNGPSMKKLDPIKIKNYSNNGYDIIACNGFIQSDFGKHIKPNYMVFSDPLDFKTVPNTHPRKFRELLGKKDKQDAINEQIPIFAPINFLNYEKYDNCYFFNDCEDIFSNNISNILAPRGYGSWTGNKALSIATYLGYSEIYICGLDYDIFKKINVNSKNEIFTKNEHFYDSKDRDSYVFERSKSGYNVAKFLYQAHINLIIFDKFKKHPIINLSKEGLIDSFQKKHKLDVYLKKD
jgi:uncharacterized Rossmann fold enzyme